MLNFRFDHPEYLLLLLLAVPIVWLGLRSMAAYDKARRIAALSLRLLLLLLLVFMLAGLETQRVQSELTVMALIDESQSIRQFAKPPVEAMNLHQDDPRRTIDGWLKDWFEQAGQDEHRMSDQFGVIRFDGRASVARLALPGVDLNDAGVNEPIDGTNIAAAVRLAKGLFPADTGKRMVLVTDANDTTNQAQLLAAAREARAEGIPIDVLPVDYKVDHEVLVEGVYAPKQAREGQTVGLRVVMRATLPAAGVLYLKQNDRYMDLNGPAEGNGAAISPNEWQRDRTRQDADRYVLVKDLAQPTAGSGATHFQVIFEPADDSDAMAANNRAETFTHIFGKGRVLFVDDVGGDMGRILPDTLAEHGIELDIITGDMFPGSMLELQRYDAVIFQNVAAEKLTGEQQQLLATYVNDLGGGLVMIGGPDSFGAGGWTNSPIDTILPVECRIPSQTIMPSGALVLVIDRSGSMASNVAGTTISQQKIASEAAVQAIKTLFPRDLIGVIAFDSSPQWIVKLTLNSNPAGLAQLIRAIQPGGGTNIYPALEEAYRALEPLTSREAAIRHIILLTDGQAPPAPYYKLVGQMVQHNITMSAVGIGDFANDPQLQQITQMAGGQYHKVADPRKLPQIFIKEARMIRKNLIKEEPFTPKLVQTGSPITAGMTAMPPLRGLVLTGVKRDGRAITPIVGGEGEPLFAHWQVGLGRSAAFTSDATNRWAADWLNWGGYADFWARVVRNIARPSASRDFDLVARIEGENLHIRLDAGSGQTQGSFANFMSVRGGIIRPDGSTQPIELEQVGPGLYETTVSARDTGNYLVSLTAESGDERRVIVGGDTRILGAELRNFESNRPMLEQIAQITGGRVLDLADPKAAALFSRDDLAKTVSIRPLWFTLLFALVVVFMLDVACRRVAWDLASILAGIRSRAAAVSRSMRGTQTQSHETLQALKRTARRTQENIDRRSVPDAMPMSETPAPSAKRKFDAGDDLLDLADGEDLAQSLGGAQAASDKPRIVPVADAAAKEQDEQQNTTNRLLAAKRRAREQMRTDNE